MENLRQAPSWATVVAAVCLVAVLALAWVVQHLWTGLEVERTYRESTRGKLIELLTIMKHTQCDEIEEMQETVDRLLEDIQDQEGEE